jgi:hypothetical protein
MRRDVFLVQFRIGQLNWYTFGLDGSGIRVRFPAGITDVSVSHSIQTASRVHEAFYPVAAGGSFPGCKAAGA